MNSPIANTNVPESTDGNTPLTPPQPTNNLNFSAYVAQHRAADPTLRTGALRDVNGDWKIDAFDLFEVQDYNNDKKIDMADVKWADQNNIAIPAREEFAKPNLDKLSTAIANSDARITLFGEEHSAPPNELLDLTLSKIKQDFIFIYEASELPGSSIQSESGGSLKKDNPEIYYATQKLLKKFNSGEIRATDFLPALRNIIFDSPNFQRYSQHDKESIYKAVEIAVQNGARQVHLVDNKDVYASGRTPNRDEMMATEISQIARDNPNAKIVGVFGRWHTAEQPYTKNPLYGSQDIDWYNPLARRLGKEFGDKNILSIADHALGYTYEFHSGQAKKFEAINSRFKIGGDRVFDIMLYNSK